MLDSWIQGLFKIRTDVIETFASRIENELFKVGAPEGYYKPQLVSEVSPYTPAGDKKENSRMDIAVRMQGFAAPKPLLLLLIEFKVAAVLWDGRMTAFWALLQKGAIEARPPGRAIEYTQGGKKVTDVGLVSVLNLVLETDAYNNTPAQGSPAVGGLGLLTNSGRSMLIRGSGTRSKQLYVSRPFGPRQKVYQHPRDQTKEGTARTGAGRGGKGKGAQPTKPSKL